MNAIITRPNALIDLNAAIAAECAKLGLPTPLRTRADLSDLPDFNVISCDDSGLPLAYLNTYHCSDCNQSWEDRWSCGVDDECPCCGADYSPETSTLCIPETYVALFELLPETV